MSPRSWVILLAAFALPAILWIGADVYQRGKSSLPPDVTTIDLYLERMPAPERAFVLERDGELFYVMVGPLPPWPAVPSGHPHYVFDRKGQVVDWTGDIGVGSAYLDRWSDAVRKHADVNEAIQSMRLATRSN